MRADRLLALLLHLQARGRTTAQELAAELQVSVRTTYRDMQALSAAGAPVRTAAGPGGGCELMEGHRRRGGGPRLVGRSGCREYRGRFAEDVVAGRL